MTDRYACPHCHTRHAPRCGTITERWPMQPLIDAYQGSNFAEAAQASSDVIRRARERGLDDLVADRWATRLGLHPVQVWGWEWCDAALSVIDRQFLAEGWRPAWEHDEHPEPEAVAA